MEFQKLPRSQRPPDGYRLACVQDVIENAEIIPQEGIFTHRSTLRLLDGWVKRDLRPEVGFRKHTHYMLVVKAENSGSGGRFRKKLYSGITLSNEGREAALLFSCEDENREVIYWLLIEIIGRKDESDHLRNAFDNTFHEKMWKGYLGVVDGLLALAVRLAENDIDWKTELHSALKFQSVVDQLIFAELIFKRCNSAQETHGKGRRHSDKSEKVDEDTANVDLQRLVKEALVNHHIEMVYDLLELGSSLTPQPDIIAHGRGGKTLLHYAAEFGDGENALNVIKLFVEKYDAGEEFVRKKDEYGTTVLHLASLFGRRNLFKYLISDCLFRKEYLSEVRDKYGQNPLHYAAKGGSEEIVDILLEEAFIMPDSMDEKRKTPLHVASEEGHRKIVKKLLSKSERAEDYARKTDSFGQTALHKAASRGHRRIVKRILKIMNRYRPDWDNAGRTSLHFAVLLGYFQEIAAKEITEMLLGYCRDEKDKYLLLCSSAVGIGNVVQSAWWNPRSLAEEKKKIEESLIKKFGASEIYFMRRAVSECSRSGKMDLLRDFFDTYDTDGLQKVGKFMEVVSTKQEAWDETGTVDSLHAIISEKRLDKPDALFDGLVESVVSESEAFSRQQLDAPTIASSGSGMPNFAAGLAALFLSPYVKSPITAGILGRWGMGKSSVMLQTETILLYMAAFPHFLPAESLPKAKEIVPTKKWRKLGKLITQEVEAKVAGPSQGKFLPMRLYQSKYRGILKSLASMDRSHMFTMYDAEKNSFSNYSGGHMNILTVFYNAWHYRDEHEAWAGLAVEITKEIESAMTIAQWLSTCWRYASTRERESFYLQLILPSLIAIIIAVGVVVVAWILLSTSNNKQLSGFIRYGSIPATLVGIAWVVMKSAFSVLKPVSSQMGRYMRFPDHTARLGYQQKVIDDINFLKEEIGQEPKLFCSLIAHTWWPWNWLGLCQNNVAGTAIPKVRPASTEKLRIVVFVDDLDRCQDSVILKVLSAINLVLAACNIDVILGIDNKMIERAVKKEFADIGERNEIKQDLTENYVRKIIQIPLVLSHPSALASIQLGGTEDSTPGEAKERSSPTENVASSDDDASQERSTSDAPPAESGECGVNIEEDDVATNTRHNTSLKTKICGLVRNTISSCFHYLNIQEGFTWYSKSEPEWNGHAPPWYGKELAGQRLRITLSNKEREALMFLGIVLKSDLQPLRESREFENYHFVARNILSKDPLVQVMEEWEIQLIVWIFCCWQWRRQINTIIQNWVELVQAAVSNGRQPETRNRYYGPSLREIVHDYINKRFPSEQNPGNESELVQIGSTRADEGRRSKLLQEDVYVQERESKEQHVDWRKVERLWKQREQQQAWLRSIKEAQAKEKEAQIAWLNLKYVLTTYDVSMEGIQYFQGFRFHCNTGYLSWNPQWANQTSMSALPKRNYFRQDVEKAVRWIIDKA